MLPRQPALSWRLAWMSRSLSPHPPLHRQASSLGTWTAPSLSLYRTELRSLAPFSMTCPRPSSSPLQHEQSANYVRDSLLTMSKATYQKARSPINRLLSDFIDEDSDDGIPSAMGTPLIPATQQHSHIQPPPLRTSSAPSFSSSSPSEQFQPPPTMWRHVPPASSVWGSQSTEYMEQYHQQPFQHPHQQMPRRTPTPVSAALCAAAQVLMDQSSPGTGLENLPNISGLSNISGLFSGSPLHVCSQEGELNTPPPLQNLVTVVSSYVLLWDYYDYYVALLSCAISNGQLCITMRIL